MSNCPHCSSGNTQTFKMACMTGTSVSEGIIAGIGTDVDDGFIGFSETIKTSSLAKALAPPQKKKVSCLLTLACFSFFPLLFALLSVERKYKKWNEEEYPKLYKEWEKSWICLSCGTKFTTEEGIIHDLKRPNT